ncbi:MAG: quinone-dependent dihydroorotate dehydrogenase [Bacteroidota bacterium]|nr:quinone-dependent dihydroorotate dehydrogenase [Bacteroidota bacterium]MDP3144811.1 quinone-dependent dihydroorotate dehydrogenase [Bacteroidota bacterium]MDP3557818.1 quinone-dependent dihydroorotate dehydrogenase [Bacteroidota bacterium]
MYKILKSLLFQINPESAHHLTFSLLKLGKFLPFFTYFSGKSSVNLHPSLAKNVFGLNFRNPVGLAAGLDKDAIAFNELGDFGFGFIEIGTVTPKPQPGNDKPRLFRLPKNEALINRMGFNNHGVTEAAKKLRNRKDKTLIIGGNIGKNKLTSNEDAVNDYIICFNELFDVVDYFVVNVSSPNTPNLRDLQEKEPLTKLLNTLQNLNLQKTNPKPILLKIAPDLTNTQLDDIIDIIKDTNIAGVIATNTTISREGLDYDASQIEKFGAGGLSGLPLTKRSTEVIRYLKQKSNNAFPIIGVGGIHSAEDALEKIKAGADLIQLYTGFIYHGPKLISDINKKLIKHD